MQIDILIQVALGGLLIGGVYALFAFGLSLTYGVARILNFAHGTLVAIAGVTGSIIYVLLGGNSMALLVSIAVLVAAFFAFGWGFHDLLLAPLKRRNHFEASVGTVLVTVGAMIIIGDVAATLAGPRPRNIPIRADVIEIGAVLLPVSQAYMLGGITVVTILLQLVLARTWYGRAVRAVTQDHVGAEICGVKSRIIHGITFGLGAALAAIAGVFYVTVFPIDPYGGFSLTVKAFTIIVLGGVGNLAGALVAGLLLGMAEAFTSFLWATRWAPAVSISLLLIIIVAFPHGFSPRRVR